jgi:CheY-like chemotaxis protein
MGGFINIESVKDKGTTVTIRLPLVKDEASADNAEGTQKTTTLPGYFKNLKILAAEDNHFNRMLLKIIFDKYNLQYDLANNGIEAVKLINEKEFDIVLMDIQMPEMDGLEATEEIRKQKGSMLPVIALTANAVKEELDSYLQKGITDYILKHFEEERLLQLLQKYVRV